MKPDTQRVAVARCRVSMSGSTLGMIKSGAGPKGEVFGTARITATMACKKTPDLIPMCHSISVTGIDVAYEADEENGIVELQVTAKTVGKIGAEMEALSFQQVGQCVMPKEGAFAKVMRGGEVKRGDVVRVGFPVRSAILTISDKGFRGERADVSGDVIDEEARSILLKG